MIACVINKGYSTRLYVMLWKFNGIKLDLLVEGYRNSTVDI